MSPSPDTVGTGSSSITLYEAAVPVLAFGGAALGVLAWTVRLATDLRLTAACCVAASVLLAYLAWIRPKKDIVSLTTPIYAFIFFAVPPDDPVETIVLELLYAASLTALLVRLKYRFGSAEPPGRAEAALPPVLVGYVEKLQPACACLPPAAAHCAATAFLRYTAGEYGEVRHEADEGILALDRSGCASAFVTAFEIVREQAEITEKSRPRPEWYRHFEPADEPLLARPLPVTEKGADGYDPGYDAALDNALLLLFAGAWNAVPEEQKFLRTATACAARIISG